MWYEVEDRDMQYLCAERADAFLLAILPYAMKESIDVNVDAPLSEQLYYQLTTTFIPALAGNTKTWRSFRLECDSLDNTVLPSANAVGSGFSGGVDSFYTVYTHLNTKAPHHNLTYLTFFNVGASGDSGGEESRRLYLERLKPARAFAEDSGLGFVSVDSNINEFLNYQHLHTHTMRSMSAVLALQKLFSVYYYSSSRTLGEFALGKGDEAAGYFDLLSASCFTNENTGFYITGPNEKRTEKCASIAGYPPSYEYLNVCLTGSKNCGRCEKCVRTMLELYAVGKLQLYSAVFDVSGFMARLNKNLAILVRESSDPYYSEIRDTMKTNGVGIPVSARIIGNIRRIEKLFPGLPRRIKSVFFLKWLYNRV